MKIDSQKQYIHIERDNKEERIIIDAKNISSEDAIYLLTEFIYFVTNKENVPADGFIDLHHPNDLSNTIPFQGLVRNGHHFSIITPSRV